jgi:SpoVK/Ycf46/Vps4 family AAA+-type ATPase
MAEKDSPVFLVATANDISALPPELVRKGRFDEIIFCIHLKKRDLDPEQFDIGRLGEASEGFSGAEIEQSVVSALYLAHSKGKELSTEGGPGLRAVLTRGAAARGRRPPGSCCRGDQ